MSNLLQCQAISFVRRADSGRSRPPLVLAEAHDGELIDVWIKAPGLHNTISEASLAREWMAAKVAIALGIPCATPLCVSVSPEFIGTLQSEDLAEKLRNGPELVYGSRNLGSGWRRWTQAASLPRSKHQSQAEAYLFDTLIQNWDRRIANPNILRLGDQFRLIDHEETFATASGSTDERSYAKLPWKVGGISNHIMGDYQHPFWRAIKTSRYVNFPQAAASWQRLPKALFLEYANEAPEDWGRSTCNDIAAYLADAVDHLGEIVATIERAREQ